MYNDAKPLHVYLASSMTPAVKAAVVIKKGDTFLLVQENGARSRGWWNWPQGRVEEGETPEEAAIREAKEETGFDITIVRKLAVLTETFPDTKELHVFLGNITGGSLNFPRDEIMAAQYFTLEQIIEMKEKLAGPWIPDVISQVK